jgi:hypothetical protein
MGKRLQVEKFRTRGKSFSRQMHDFQIKSINTAALLTSTCFLFTADWNMTNYTTELTSDFNIRPEDARHLFYLSPTKPKSFPPYFYSLFMDKQLF